MGTTSVPLCDTRWEEYNLSCITPAPHEGNHRDPVWGAWRPAEWYHRPHLLEWLPECNHKADANGNTFVPGGDYLTRTVEWSFNPARPALVVTIPGQADPVELLNGDLIPPGLEREFARAMLTAALARLTPTETS